MRIALLHPTQSGDAVPEPEGVVLRLARDLVGRGHEVVIFTDQRRRSTEQEGLHFVATRRPPRLRVMRFYEDHVEVVPMIVWQLVHGSFDIAHSFVPAAAWAGIKAQRMGGPPIVFSLLGDLQRRWLVARRYRLEMMLEVAGAAGECLVRDSGSQRRFRRYLLREPRLIAAGAGADEYLDVYASVSAGDSKGSGRPLV